MSSGISGSRPRLPDPPRVLVLDSRPQRLFVLGETFLQRDIVASLHPSEIGFWRSVLRIRPTVLVLEMPVPPIGALRTHAKVTEMLGRPPGLVLCGWAAFGPLARMRDGIRELLVLEAEAEADEVVDAVERVHATAGQRLPTGAPSVPLEAAPPDQGGTYVLDAQENDDWIDESDAGRSARARVRSACRARLDARDDLFAVEIRTMRGDLVEIVERDGIVPSAMRKHLRGPR